MIAVRVIAILLGVMLFVGGVTTLLDIVRFVWVYRSIIAKEHPGDGSRLRAAAMPAYAIIPMLLGFGGLWLIQWGWAG